MKNFKGIIHVHSNYSYDGKHSIDEIAAFARQRSYAFVGMSEHSDTLDSDKVARLREECQKASTADCLIIPGIEFTCLGNLHLIGLGVQDYDSSKDPLVINDFIQQQGGVAIIAHPKRYHYQISEGLLTAVNGVEIWNAGYDGRFVPNDQSLKLLKSGRERQKALLAFGGQDLHQIDLRHRQVHLKIHCDRLVSDAVIGSMRDGNFVISNGYVSVGAKARLHFLKALPIYLGNRLYAPVKNLRDRFV
jgi:predicted metal-dependent phosphoesterase TrpH